MKPQWNSIRNFHCMWFEDSHVLNDYFGFQREDVKDYWQEILSTHPYYKLGKILPAKLVSKLAIERLLKDENAPRYWVNTKQDGKVKAFFGSRENLACLPNDWSKYPILCHGQLADGYIDYDDMRDETKLKEHGYILDHGYDETKPDEQLDIEDMRQAAAFRGGKCLSESMEKGDLYTKLEWECHDGHRFSHHRIACSKRGIGVPNVASRHRGIMTDCQSLCRFMRKCGMTRTQKVRIARILRQRSQCEIHAILRRKGYEKSDNLRLFGDGQHCKSVQHIS